MTSGEELIALTRTRVSAKIRSARSRNFFLRNDSQGVCRLGHLKDRATRRATLRPIRSEFIPKTSGPGGTSDPVLKWSLMQVFESNSSGVVAGGVPNGSSLAMPTLV